MTARTRLCRLERTVRNRPLPTPRPREEKDRLAAFEAKGRKREFDREPDFPRALEYFHRAIHDAKAQVNPPFKPTAHFRPDNTRTVRFLDWRSKPRCPAAWAGFDWLFEISLRTLTGIPPVTEAEFGELRDWFKVHGAELWRRIPSRVFDVGDGRRVSLADIHYKLRGGAWAPGAGRVAEDMRQVRIRYGSDGHTPLGSPPSMKAIAEVQLCHTLAVS